MKAFTITSPLPALKAAIAVLKENDAPRRASSLAYYTALSLGPLLLVAISIASLIIGREAARAEIYDQLQDIAGPSIVRSVQKITQSGNTPAGAIGRGLMAFGLFLFGASKVFRESKRALHAMWRIDQGPSPGVWPSIRGRLLSMGMVLGICLLPLVSLALDAGIGAVESIGLTVPGNSWLRHAGRTLLGLSLTTGLLGVLYKYLPGNSVSWREVWVGSVIAALLFTLGKRLLELVISSTSEFGTPGALTLILIWVYYAALIFLFGAALIASRTGPAK